MTRNPGEGYISINHVEIDNEAQVPTGNLLQIKVIYVMFQNFKTNRN